MKRTTIAATIAALSIPVVFTAPAYASNNIAVSVDNTEGSYDLSVYLKVDCGDGRVSTVGSPDAPLVFPAGKKSGEYPSCVLGNWGDGTYEFTLTANGQTVNCNGGISSPVIGPINLNNFNGDSVCRMPFGENGPFASPNFLFFTKNDNGVYNFSVNPTYANESTNIYILGSVASAANFNTAETRSKSAGYVTLQPNRVTAMAKRFVASSGDLINIHAYGPNKDVALARAEHVRAHLQLEITRLGGDPADYPTFVVYAGDPDHKKGTHVTIHQHSASAITFP